MTEPHVLGWANRGELCPADVTRHAAGTLDVLVTRKGATAKDRLLAQLACFEQALDFVPAAPIAALSATKGVRLAHQFEDELRLALKGLNGQGQLALTLRWSEPPVEHAEAATGRAWLWARQREMAAVNGQKAHAQLVLDQLVVDETAAPVEANQSCLKTALLVPRSQLQPLCSKLRMAAKSIAAQGLTLTVSGLWPPLNFVKPFSAMQRRAA